MSLGVLESVSEAQFLRNEPGGNLGKPWNGSVADGPQRVRLLRNEPGGNLGKPWNGSVADGLQRVRLLRNEPGGKLGKPWNRGWAGGAGNLGGLDTRPLRQHGLAVYHRIAIATLE